MSLSPVRALAILCIACTSSLPAMPAVKMTQTMVFHGYGPSNAGRNRATTTTLIQGVRSRTETSMEFEGKVLKRLTGTQIGVSITDAERKVMLDLHPKRETYTEMTFDQFLAQRDELTDQLDAAMRGPAAEGSEDGKSPRPQMEFGPPEITVDQAGSARIAGYDARLLDVLVKLEGSYPESSETCEIHVKANLGFADTPGADEVLAYYTKLAEELGFSKSQMLGAGRSVLSAMGNYAEGFDKLYDEIRKQKGTLVRQNLRVQVKGACGGPASGQENRDPASGSASSSDDATSAAPGAKVKKMFGKLKFGRKKKKEEAQQEDPPPAPKAGDEFTLMMAIDVETDSYEKVADVGSGPFTAPAEWKKVEASGRPR